MKTEEEIKQSYALLHAAEVTGQLYRTESHDDYCLWTGILSALQWCLDIGTPEMECPLDTVLKEIKKRVSLGAKMRNAHNN